MSTTNDADDIPPWREHGYYEVFVPVWNPETGEQPVNLTLDIVGNEEKLNDINHHLVDDIEQYTRCHIDEQSELERVFQQNLGAMLRRNLIWDAHCSSFDINDVDDLRERLEDNDFALFPL